MSAWLCSIYVVCSRFFASIGRKNGSAVLLDDFLALFCHFPLLLCHFLSFLCHFFAPRNRFSGSLDDFFPLLGNFLLLRCHFSG
jgi:hypothetical protein